MSEDKPKPEPRPCLEELLDTKPLLSDPIRIKRDNAETDIIFREVPNDMKNRLKEQAIQYVEDRRRTMEKGGEGEWRDVASDLDVLRADEQELRILHAAMLDPKTHAPACSLDWLRRRMGSDLHNFLGNKYSEFEASVSPDAATEEQIEALIDAVKKNVDLALLWTEFGSLTALRCVQFLVLELERSQTAQSSGTSSGETPPSKPQESTK